MEQLTGIFPIFFLTLGPLRGIPVFAALTHAMEPKARHALAVRTILIIIIITFLVAFVGRALLEFWGVPREEVVLAGGLIFLLSALKVVFTFGQEPPHEGPPPTHPALSPLAVPSIISPFGVAAILIYMMIARDANLELKVVGVMSFVILLDFVGLWFAEAIMKVVGVSVLQVVGWIFGVLQTALAVDVIAIPLHLFR